MKHIVKLFACFTLLIAGVVSIVGISYKNTQQNLNNRQKVRTITYENNIIVQDNIFKDFDEYIVNSEGNTLEVIAKKNFDMSILEEINLVGLDETEETFTVRYDVDYIPDENTVLLSITIEGTEEIPVVEIIPGLITLNSLGEEDVMFAVEGEYLWLSDLIDDGLLNETGWFSWLKKAVSDVANGIKKAINSFIQNGLKLIRDLVTLNFNKFCADIGAIALNMTEEVDAKGNGLGIYHADFDCWQSAFGYTDFYDKVFKAFTCMERKKFMYSFDVDNDGDLDDYILWAWKGDYLNLGAGAELGVYKRWAYDSEFWIVDKSQAMNMTLKLTKNNTTVFNYQPTEKQWWITGFNYKYHTTQYELDYDIIKAYYTVTFNNFETYNAFKKANDNRINKDEVWDYKGSYKFTYSF